MTREQYVASKRKEYMAPLTTDQRNALPANLFGIPETRSYPLPTLKYATARDVVSHAQNAKGRAIQGLWANQITRAQYDHIVAMAEARLAEARAA